MFDQVTGGSKAVAFVEVVGAEVLVPGRSLQHVVAGAKDRISHGPQRPLGIAQSSQALELRLQVSPFAFACCKAALHQALRSQGLPAGVVPLLRLCLHLDRNIAVARTLTR